MSDQFVRHNQCHSWSLDPRTCRIRWAAAVPVPSHPKSGMLPGEACIAAAAAAADDDAVDDDVAAAVAVAHAAVRYTKQLKGQPAGRMEADGNPEP